MPTTMENSTSDRAGGLQGCGRPRWACWTSWGRVASDFLKRNYLQDSTRWTESKLYFAAMWGEIVLGSIILALGFTQPIALLLVPPARPRSSL